MRNLTFEIFSSPHLVWLEILFSQKHEWVRVDGNVGTVGVSHYAQESLGDVVYVLSPEIGAELEQNGKPANLKDRLITGKLT